MDSVYVLVASAFGGALVTAVVGTITFIFAGRREHRRWLYNLKYKNYLKVLRVWHHWQRLAAAPTNKDEFDTFNDVYLKITELVAADLVLVNSVRVERSFTGLLDAMVTQITEIESNQRDTYELNEEWTELVNDMRKDLAIKGRITAGVVPSRKGGFRVWFEAHSFGRRS